MSEMPRMPRMPRNLAHVQDYACKPPYRHDKMRHDVGVLDFQVVNKASKLVGFTSHVIDISHSFHPPPVLYEAIFEPS